VRTLIEIPDHQIEDLTAIGAARKVSRAQLVREAIDAFIQRYRPSRESAFGLWRGRPETLKDGLDYQERLRSEW
jgi:hypothetical protein